MFGFIERVIIPTLVLFLLVGGLSGALLGAALMWRSDAALRFVSRMNRWVSTRDVLRPLEVPHMMSEPSPRLRRWLGVCLTLGGAFVVGAVLARMNVERGGYVPGVDLRRWLFSGVTLEWIKWFLVVGGAFSFVVGGMMLFMPERLAAFEALMNRWYSSPRLLAAEETMHLPLEPRVEANPRLAGGIIAVASLLVAAAMLVLLFGKIR
jgi:hypothetical protein